MSKIKYKTTLSLLVLAVVSVAIGCGDGKSKKSRVKRGGSPLAQGKAAPAAGQPGAQPAGKGALTPPPAVNGGAGNTGSAGGTGATTTPSADNAEKQAKEKRITEIKDFLTKGSTTGLQQLEEGTYSLESTMSAIKIMPLNGSWVEAVSGFNLDSNRRLVPDPQTQESSGILQDTDFGRKMSILASFNVKQPFSPPRGTENLWLYETKLEKSGADATSLQMSDSVTDPKGQPTPPISMLDVLAGRTTDETGKTINTSLKKTEDGRLRIVLEIHENARMIRVLAFNYRLERSTANKGAGTELPANDNSGTAPAQTDAKQEMTSSVQN